VALAHAAPVRTVACPEVQWFAGSWRHVACTIARRMHPAMLPERRRLLDRLIREIHRGELQAVEHAARLERQIGAVGPVLALREIAGHATAMRDRFDTIVRGHDLQTGRASFGTTLSSLRGLADRVIDPERTYRASLLDLRHGIDVVKLAREVARSEELFGLIRWCDDYLGARRTLVARVEAQLVWFVEDAGVSRTPPEAPVAKQPRGMPIALIEVRHEQEDAPPDHVWVHPSRTT
jgi:hypothetical protein